MLDARSDAIARDRTRDSSIVERVSRATRKAAYGKVWEELTLTTARSERARRRDAHLPKQREWTRHWDRNQAAIETKCQREDAQVNV